MSTSESITAKQQRLVAQAARQRGELAFAFNNIKKPIFYTEQAMKGFGFLRQNPWVLNVIPAGMSIVSTVFGLVRNKPTKSARLARRLLGRETEREVEREGKTLGGHLLSWGGRGWQLFRLYSRLRKFL